MDNFEPKSVLGHNFQWIRLVLLIILSIVMCKVSVIVCTVSV